MNYKVYKWQQKRKKILRRDAYLCQECKRYGKNVEATTVHHIIPADERSDLLYISNNLISLCNGCHNMMHDRDTGKLSEKGYRLRKKHNPLLKLN